MGSSTFLLSTPAWHLGFLWPPADEVGRVGSCYFGSFAQVPSLRPSTDWTVSRGRTSLVSRAMVAAEPRRRIPSLLGFKLASERFFVSCRSPSYEVSQAATMVDGHQ
ncbi:hypothetical protein BJX63DRAFT_349870 [Aspergillus granulosus]|uniref:Secreted protein n=1 Tax=Aspergillus granulosus TaxID=176169 RepID=A0ABR4H330_9EURO